MGRAASRYRWEYSHFYKWWRGSRGAGAFALQHSRTSGRWYVLRLPMLGGPELITDFPTKAEAKKYVETHY